MHSLNIRLDYGILTTKPVSSYKAIWQTYSSQGSREVSNTNAVYSGAYLGPQLLHS